MRKHRQKQVNASHRISGAEFMRHYADMMSRFAAESEAAQSRQKVFVKGRGAAAVMRSEAIPFPIYLKGGAI